MNIKALAGCVQSSVFMCVSVGISEFDEAVSMCVCMFMKFLQIIFNHQCQTKHTTLQQTLHR